VSYYTKVASEYYVGCIRSSVRGGCELVLYLLEQLLLAAQLCTVWRMESALVVGLLTGTDTSQCLSLYLDQAFHSAYSTSIEAVGQACYVY
jgi:hypothetical protein